MLRLTLFLSAIILVSCKHGKGVSDHSLADRVKQIKRFVNELAIDTVSEGNDLVHSDLEELYETPP